MPMYQIWATDSPRAFQYYIFTFLNYRYIILYNFKVYRVEVLYIHHRVQPTLSIKYNNCYLVLIIIQWHNK